MDNLLSRLHQPPRSSSIGALPAAVLWDMDGTIIDTEPQWLEAEVVLAARYGKHWTHQMGEELIGRALTESILVFQERTGIEADPAELIDELIQEMIHLVGAGVADWRPGAVELLTSLKELEVPCALVTMSYQGLADIVLGMLPEGLFDVVVTGDQVTHGKPHPEAYLLAAKRLGVDVRETVALEDSVAGVTSAAASGARTIAIPAHQHVPESSTYAVVESLAGVNPHDLLPLAASRAGQ